MSEALEGREGTTVLLDPPRSCAAPACWDPTPAARQILPIISRAGAVVLIAAAVMLAHLRKENVPPSGRSELAVPASLGRWRNRPPRRETSS
ncbi:MAG: hypothetical protein ACE141_06300 [Bryobacteraceae bacterium]